MLLVRDSVANATIIVRENAREPEISAAKELQKYLKKMSTANVPIRTEGESDGNLIYVGNTRRAKELGINVEKIAPEGFRIKTVGESLILVGKDEAGIEHAVHYFLEKHCGVRWFFPGEIWEIVPKTKDVVVGEVDEAKGPDFTWRATPLKLSPETVLWMKRNRIGGLRFEGVHGFESMVPADKYGSIHPEYFALKSGKRDANAQLCTSNPEVIGICVDFLRKYFDENKDVDGVTISPKDGGSFCECENCKALDTGDVYTADRPSFSVNDPLSGPSMTDRVFIFANQLAKELAKTHPEKYLLMLVYRNYVKPPKKVKLMDNVIAWYCMSCVGHWNAERRKLDFERLRELKKFAKHIAIYEYYLNSHWPDLYRLIVPLIGNSLRCLHKEGVRFFCTQMGEGFACNGLNYYVASKLLWDSSLDERKIILDFCEKAFGKAMIPIRKFFETLEVTWRDATVRSDLKGPETILSTQYLYDQLVTIFKPQLLEELKGYLDEAESLVKDDLVRQRVVFLRKGLEYHEVTMKFVRAIKRVEALGLPEFTATKLYPLDLAKDIIRRMHMCIPESDKVKVSLEETIQAWDELNRFIKNTRGGHIYGNTILKKKELRAQGPILRELLKAIPDLP